MDKKISFLFLVLVATFVITSGSAVYAAKVDSAMMSVNLPSRFSEDYISSSNDDKYIDSTYKAYYNNKYMEFYIDVDGGFSSSSRREYNDADVAKVKNFIQNLNPERTCTVLSSSLTSIGGVSAIKIRYRDYIATHKKIGYFETYYVKTDHNDYQFTTWITDSQGYLNTAEYQNMINSIVIKDTVKNTRVTPFVDVKETDWYYKAIKHSYSRGIINGTSSYKFSPNAKLTRGMIVTILYGMEGKPKVSAVNKFCDVAKSKYYYNAVLWASQKGIVNGSNGKFRPDDNITRQDLAVILMAYSRYKKKYVASNNTLGGFSDRASVASYALPAVKWAVSNRIINGSNCKINPKGTATRAEATTMIYSYMLNIK